MTFLKSRWTHAAIVFLVFMFLIRTNWLIALVAAIVTYFVSGCIFPAPPAAPAAS